MRSFSSPSAREQMIRLWKMRYDPMPRCRCGREMDFDRLFLPYQIPGGPEMALPFPSFRCPKTRWWNRWRHDRGQRIPT
jgi:hypothetical protein